MGVDPVSIFASIVLSVALSLAEKIIVESMAPDVHKEPENRDPGIKTNTCDTQARCRVVYGTREVGGNDVYKATLGTDNKYLWIVQNLAEGECAHIYQDGGVDQLFLGDKLWNTFGGNVSYWFHSGASDQTYDTNLNAADANWTENKRNTTYIVWRFKFDRDYFQSIPTRSVVLKGKKVYDFRDTSTAYSANPVLCLYDYLTSTRYGPSLAAAKLDTATWTSAANYCDTKGWTLNMVVTGDDNPADVRDKILQHFRGHMTWWDGKYYLHYSDLNYESSVMDLTDAHIAQSESGKAIIRAPQPSMWKRPDGIRVKYADPDNHYVEDNIIIGESDGVIEEMSLEGCTDRQMAADLGVYNLERAQLDRTIILTCRDDAIKLDPHNLVTLTTTALSISDQTMRVADAYIRPDGLINLILLYESVDLYDTVYNLIAEGTYTTTLPDPTDEPPGVGNATMTEETYAYRDRTMVRLNISFSSPADYAWFDYVEVWLSYDDSTYVHQFDTTTNFEIPNVIEGDQYWVKLRTVSIWKTKQTMANAVKLTETVQGVASTAPDSLTALKAIVSGNVINLFATRVSSDDVYLYEFRLGASWSGAVPLAALASPNLSLQGVKPGAHTFTANVLGTNGIYGATPRFAAASLQDPPDGWTVVGANTQTCDYDAVGTHDNTEHFLYGGTDDYLKCSHTAGVLVGTYTSPIYDLTASGRYLVYILGDIVVTGAGNTWDDIIPDPDVWTGIGISTRTWSEIFAVDSGPSINITLKYGDASPPTNEVSKMEILSAIATGRYFQVVIEITDPSAAINGCFENFTMKFCQ